MTQSIERAVRDAGERWRHVSDALNERLDRFHAVQRQWQTYDSEVEVIRAWIEAREVEVKDMMRRPGSGHLDRAKVCNILLLFCAGLFNYVSHASFLLYHAGNLLLYYRRWSRKLVATARM